LEKLQYGESMVIYRGSQDLAADIRRNAVDSPNYCAVLMAIRETAERLEQQGRIEIVVHEIKTDAPLINKIDGHLERVRIFEHVATSIAKFIPLQRLKAGANGK
jgi:hypothetical protein